jgi:hypothetical protein
MERSQTNGKPALGKEALPPALNADRRIGLTILAVLFAGSVGYTTALLHLLVGDEATPGTLDGHGPTVALRLPLRGYECLLRNPTESQQ